MNVHGLSSAAAHERARDLRRVACDDRLAERASCCRDSGLTRAARRVGALTRRDARS